MENVRVGTKESGHVISERTSLEDAQKSEKGSEVVEKRNERVLDTLEVSGCLLRGDE